MTDVSARRVETEKGAAAHPSTMDPRCDLFFSLVRDCADDRLEKLFEAAIAHARNLKDPNILADIVVLTFQTRDIRGGKGERRLFIRLFTRLYSAFPKTTVELLPFVTKFGYWKDLFLIVAETLEAKSDETGHLRAAIANLCADQLRKDLVELQEAKTAGRHPNISLCAKYFPRERKSLSKRIGDFIAVVGRSLTPKDYQFYKPYLRKNILSPLNIALQTPEVMMCAGKWESINFSHVGSSCLMRNRKAFLNQNLVGSGRRSSKIDRIKARENFMRTLHKKKINSATLFPHEIVGRVLKDINTCEMLQIYASIGEYAGHVRTLSQDEKLLINTQWEVLVESTQKRFADLKVKKDALKSDRVVDLGNVVAMVDTSASMSGLPMEVAVALGLLVSQVASPAYRNRVMTFSSKPQWQILDGDNTLYEQVVNLDKGDWGHTTNIEAAFDLILDVAKQARLSPDQIPDLIVFSDMQFDVSQDLLQGEWPTIHEKIVEKFAKAGESVCGSVWPAPSITFWNLRAETVGFPVTANTPNVRMLGGFSANLLELLLSGSELPVIKLAPEPHLEVELEGTVKVVEAENVSETGSTEENKPHENEPNECEADAPLLPDSAIPEMWADDDPITAPESEVDRHRRQQEAITALVTFRTAIDNDRYDCIRLILDHSNEGLFSGFSFVLDEESPIK